MPVLSNMGCFKTVTKVKSITRNLNGEMKIFFSTCAGKLIHREKTHGDQKKPAMQGAASQRGNNLAVNMGLDKSGDHYNPPDNCLSCPPAGGGGLRDLHLLDRWRHSTKYPDLIFCRHLRSNLIEINRPF